MILHELLSYDVLRVIWWLLLGILLVGFAVTAGRNIAVLVEAAVRNSILQLRGIDTYQEFVERHRKAMERDMGRGAQ